jgi:hypothetical protein
MSDKGYCGGSNNENILPCIFSITKASDFLKIEKVLRFVLQCHGPTCSFLQSADYVDIKIAVIHAIQGRKCDDKPLVCKNIHIPNSSIVLYLLDDHKTIILKDKYSQYSEDTKKGGKFQEKDLKCENDDDDIQRCKRKRTTILNKECMEICDDDDEDDSEDDDYSVGKKSKKSKKTNKGSKLSMLEEKFIYAKTNRLYVGNNDHDN